MPQLKNIRHERFCQEVAAGKSQIEAARAAGYAEISIKTSPYVLIKRPEVIARIKELRDLTFTENIMSIIERKEKLSNIARNGGSYSAIAAIAELNKMDGAYPPTRIESAREEVIVKSLTYFAPDGTRLLNGPRE